VKLADCGISRPAFFFRKLDETQKVTVELVAIQLRPGPTGAASAP
jgi:hypothetical protein